MHSEDEYIKAVNDTVEHEGFYILDSIFSDYFDFPEDKVLRLLQYTFKTKLFTENKICLAHNFLNYWKLLNQNYLKLNENNKELVINKIGMIETWNRKIEEEIFEISKKETKIYSDNRKVQFYETNLMVFLKQDFLNEAIKDEYYKCLWFVSQINIGKSVFLNQLENEVFDFSDTSFKKLLSTLNNLEKKYIIHDYTYLMEFTALNLLAYALINNKIKVNDKRDFPDVFYENKIIQRILINIDLKENNLNRDLLDNIISNIDYKFKMYGKEMNEFVIKHNIQEAKKNNYYINGIGATKAGWVKSLPFDPVSELTDLEQVDVLIEILERTINREKDFVAGDFLKQISIEGQSKEILAKLNTDVNWKNNTSPNVEFLRKMLRNKKLLELYENVVSEMIAYATSNNFDNGDLANKYLEIKFTDERHTISYLEEKVMTVLVEKSLSEKDYIYEVIFRKISPNSLKTESVITGETISEWVDLNSFINTDLGRYYTVINKIPENIIKSYFSEKIRDDINLLDNKYKDYLIGYLFNCFSDENLPEAKQNTFIGYSHNYYLNSHREDALYFKGVVLELLKTDSFSDSFTLRNITTVILLVIDPINEDVQLKNNVEFKNQILINILTSFFHKSFPVENNTYTDKWIKCFLHYENYIPLFIRHLILNFSETEEVKIEKLLSMLRLATVSNKTKVDNYNLNYIRSAESFPVRKFEKLIDLIEILLIKDYIQISSIFIQGVEGICDNMNKKGYNQLIRKLIAIITPYVLPKDISTLNSLYPGTRFD